MSVPNDLAELDRPALEIFLAARGEPRSRAQQIFRWIYQRGVTEVEAMTDLSRELRATLASDARLVTPSIAARERSSDGTEKFLLTLADGRQLLVYNPVRPEAGQRWGVRSPLAVAISDDGSAWRDVAVLETDAAKDGYSYPAVIQTRDGLVHISYTWRRERIRHVVFAPRDLR